MLKLSNNAHSINKWLQIFLSHIIIEYEWQISDTKDTDIQEFSSLFFEDNPSFSGWNIKRHQALCWVLRFLFIYDHTRIMYIKIKLPWLDWIRFHFFLLKFRLYWKSWWQIEKFANLLKLPCYFEALRSILLHHKPSLACYRTLSFLRKTKSLDIL